MVEGLENFPTEEEVQNEEEVNLPGEQEDEMFEIDGTDVETGFTKVEEGIHPAKVVDLQKTTSKQGNPMFQWDFLITGGVSQGETIRFWTSLLPQARWKVVETLEALGIPAEGKLAKFKRSQVLQLPCKVEVYHDETRDGAHSVEQVLPPDEEAIKLAKSGEDEVPF